MKEKITFNLSKQMLPMPVTVSRLLTLVRDMNSSLDDFKRVVELDPALIAHVLRWAHTFNASSQVAIKDLPDALEKLGHVNTLKLAMAQTFIASGGKIDAIQNYAENMLWYHGVACAYAANYLIELIREPIDPMVFTAALIHDIGKLLLVRHVGFEMLESALKKESTLNNLTYLEAEQKLLSVDHVEMGAFFARSWNFPELLIESIEKHHQKEPDENMFINVVILSDVIGKLVHPGVNSNTVNMGSIQKIISHMGLDNNCIYSLTAKVKEGMSQTARLWYSSFSKANPEKQITTK